MWGLYVLMVSVFSVRSEARPASLSKGRGVWMVWAENVTSLLTARQCLAGNWGSRIAVRYWMPRCGLESAFRVTPMDQVRGGVFCLPRSALTKESKSRQVISWAKTGVLPPRYDRQTKRSSRMEGGGNGSGEPWKVSWVGKLENWWGWGHELNHENHPGLKMR